MRSIDADKLKQDIFDIYEQEFPTATGMFDRFVTTIVPSIINMQPTVDVFKWHDLRDNPNDLPKEDRYYLCIFEDDDTPYYTAFSENSFGDWHHDVHCELASHPIESYFAPYDDETVVIAWTHVPHFEGKMDEEVSE